MLKVYVITAIEIVILLFLTWLLVTVFGGTMNMATAASAMSIYALIQINGLLLKLFK